jgi:hypothetical protein
LTLIVSGALLDIHDIEFLLCLARITDLLKLSGSLIIASLNGNPAG